MDREVSGFAVLHIIRFYDGDRMRVPLTKVKFSYSPTLRNFSSFFLLHTTCPPFPPRHVVRPLFFAHLFHHLYFNLYWTLYIFPMAQQYNISKTRTMALNESMKLRGNSSSIPTDVIWSALDPAAVTEE
jgi:hypothetical protein